MEQSILTGVKKILGVGSDYTEFDHDILTFINSAFSTLYQLGLGPDEGFAIEDDTAVWADFVEQDPRLNQIQTYVSLKTRVLFDPATTPYLITALESRFKNLSGDLTHSVRRVLGLTLILMCWTFRMHDDRRPAVAIGDAIRLYQHKGKPLPWDKLKDSERDYWHHIGEIALRTLWELDR